MSKRPLCDKLNLTSAEKEVIILKSILDMTKKMVNHTIFDFLGNPPTEVMFKSLPEQAYFSSIFVDFLSYPSAFFSKPSTGLIEYDFLYMLKEICENPILGEQTSLLKKNTIKFIEWLNEEVEINSYFLENSKKILISRRKYFRIIGTAYKHNLTNLTRQVETLQEVFKRNGIVKGIDEVYLYLDAFCEEIQSILAYHVSTVVEFLNNIRIGIYDYLTPICRQIGCNNKLRGKYTYPEDIMSNLGKAYFQDLINDVYSKFYIDGFKVPNILKLRY